MAATAARTARIVEALDGLSAAALSAPSALPGWSRLTITCHLRFGAEALLRMTEAGISGRPAAYYPADRASQRPGTLVPTAGERPRDVIASLTSVSRELDRRWTAVDEGAWDLEVVEPEDNPDLGTVRLSDLPLLRLTEVEVHGTDLGLGLDDWSDLFVRTALPARLRRLNVRRTNHREFDDTLVGSWLLVATDGPTFEVSVKGAAVAASPADPGSAATAVIEATSRDLLALLLGRPLKERPQVGGNRQFGEAFSAAFPGP